jgi:vancomycin resistance protein YoaR
MISSKFQPTIKQSNSKVVWFSFISGILLLLAGLIILIFIINSQKDIFPNKTTINSIDISLLSKQEAKTKITTALGEKADFSLTLELNERKIASNSSQIDFKYLIDETIDDVFIKSHNDLTLKKPLKLFASLFNNKDFSLRNEFNHEKIKDIVSEFSDKVDQKGHKPFASLNKTNKANSLKIDPGEIGLEVSQKDFNKEIIKNINNKFDYLDISFSPIPQKTHHELSEEEAVKAQERASLFVGQEIYLINNDYKDVKLIINDQDLISLLSFPEGAKQDEVDIVVNKLNKSVERESRNAIFDYEENKNGNFIVNEFIPHLDGLEIDKKVLQNKIKAFITATDGLISSPEEVKPTYLDLPLKIVEPDLTLDKTNDLGIKELIGFGDSEYDHSIPNRIWNVSLTAEKMNNILVAPGEEVSFNKTLGEVSRRNGYRSAYVISGGKTVLGDGGGVCQVSTTYFRAVLNAGLEVTKRKAHSYRVSYYELNQKPGIDATVYSGDVDLRFLNDTGKHILIRSSADSDELYMKVEIYGTSDGRTTEIVDHETWGQRGAPASAYYPTTEIPAGTFKQIDWAVSGIKASFKNVVKDKDGKLIREEEYYSNYVPWSAKYLQGI